MPAWATGRRRPRPGRRRATSRVTPGCIQISAVVWGNVIRSKAPDGKTWTRSRPSGASRTGPAKAGLPSLAMSRKAPRSRRAMRTNVPTPVNSSSPASVVPGASPLAAQAAASHSSCTAMVSVMTCWRRSARAAASVLAHEVGVAGDVVDEGVQLGRVEWCGPAPPIAAAPDPG